MGYEWHRVGVKRKAFDHFSSHGFLSLIQGSFAAPCLRSRNACLDVWNTSPVVIRLLKTGIVNPTVMELAMPVEEKSSPYGATSIRRFSHHTGFTGRLTIRPTVSYPREIYPLSALRVIIWRLGLKTSLQPVITDYAVTTQG